MADKRSKTEIFNDYEAFVDKFKPKRTTDDCYTPPEVYDAVRRWVNDNILALDGVQVVRPFFPGGDYEHFDYPENCVVIDNPPFSILAQIRRFYTARGIRYFLFAPALTCANGARELDETIIVCGANIVYANEAKISTSFLTNLPCGDTGIWCAGSLHHAIKKAIDALSRGKKPPTYFYPPNVATPATLQSIAIRGVDLRIAKTDYIRTNRLDSQRESGRTLFGGGWLLSERAAAERAAAERAAAERAAAERAGAIVWQLSERERLLIATLG